MATAKAKSTKSQARNKTHSRQCPICEKRFVSVRSDAVYCSPNCRSRADRSRRANELRALKYGLSPSAKSDLHQVRVYAPGLAESVEHVASVCGREQAERLLDGVIELALQIPAFQQGWLLRLGK